MTKTAVVTGASKGIGLATVQTLLQNDFKVYGISRTKPEFDNTNFTWIQLDLADQAQITTLETKITEFTIDLLVNDAGIALQVDSLEYTDDAFQKTFAINFTAPILVTQALSNKLSNALIININSLSDRIPENEFALYCASKAALNIYFDSIQTKYTNFKVYNILPTYVDTPMLRNLIGNSDFDWEGTVKPEEIASLILKLDSERKLPTNARIFAVTNALYDDIVPREKAFVFNSSDNSIKTLDECLINHPER